MIHIQKSGDLRRDTKTLCGLSTEGIGGKNGFVEYRNRKHCDCPTCLDVADRTETVRKGKK